ncbi:MAG: hypothetical protein MJ007_07435 [Paludibacteraceae bacterium]|nr:hypothetical protein [Paludibacteraceae bacterium]
MKKLVKLVSFATLVALFALTACKNDSKSEPSVDESKIVGTWNVFTISIKDSEGVLDKFKLEGTPAQVAQKIRELPLDPSMTEPLAKQVEAFGKAQFTFNANHTTTGGETWSLSGNTVKVASPEGKTQELKYSNDILSFAVVNDNVTIKLNFAKATANAF